MTKIKNIIFDLGGVVLKDKPNCVLDNLNIDNTLKEKIKNTFFNNWAELDLGLIDIKEHFKRCNLDNVVDEKLKDYLLHYYEHRPFNDDIVNLIKELNLKGYNIYILSDNNIDTKQYLINQKVFIENIKGYIFSCDYGISKSNKELWKILMSTYSLNPTECYFIDNKKENIEISLSLNIKGYIYKNNINGLIIDMKKNNII